MHILLMEDEEESRGVLSGLLRDLGHQVTECSDERTARDLILSESFHLILADIRMSHLPGGELLQAIRHLPSNQETEAILFAGHVVLQMIIENLNFIAHNCQNKTTKPQGLFSRRPTSAYLAKGKAKALTGKFATAPEPVKEKMPQKLPPFRKTYEKSIGLDSVIFNSDAMLQIVEQVKVLHGDRSLPVLIEGETGTGKEVVARLIHFGEHGATTPFIDLNCAAFAPSIFESELFGYEAGAFTGGQPKGQKGKFDLASGGTLFLDEITEMTIELQAKFLRVLQEKEFYRVGGLKKIKTDARIICTTNADIEQKMEQGSFRRDLFYRLDVAHIYLPPLRKRKDVIIPLAEMFLASFAKNKKKDFMKISEDAARVLKSYNWPGNIRELKNLIEWVVVMYNDTQLKTAHLDRLFRNKKNTPAMDGSLHSLALPLNKQTDNIILEALRMHRGNKTETANYLGMPLRTLHRRLQRLTESGNQDL